MDCIEQVQKIYIPTPRKFIGNSEGMGDPDTQIFKEKYKTKLEIPGGRGFKNQITILLWRFEYFLVRITHLYLNYMQGKGQLCRMSQGAH